MVKLYGSYNSRFFACLTPSEVRLYRGIAAGGDYSHANEAQLVVSRAMDESLGLDLIRVSNQGDLFFLGKKGLFRLRNDRQAKLEIVNDALCALARGEEPGRLGQVMVDADGREVCFEVITPDGGIKDRFRKLLGGKKSGGDSLNAHQVVYLNLGNQRPLNFPATLIDSRREYAFRWSISPSGRFLVQARPEKKNYHLDVIDVTDESIIADFQMALAPIHDLWVNDAGVMMVDVRQVGEEKLILALPDGVTRHSFCPPPSYRVVHLGPLHVGCILEAQRRLQIFDYSGHRVADVDYQPLRQMGVEFHFSFNDRGQIDVLCWQANTLHLQHADMKSIVVDAKRWDLSARQQQADQEHQLIQEATSQHMQERKRVEDFQLSRQLLDAVQSETPGAALPRLGAPVPLPPPISNISAIPAIPGVPEVPTGVTELPPWMAGLSSAPPIPGSPVPGVPGVPPAPASPPLPPAIVDRNSPPNLPSRPSTASPPPLPFLRGNAPMPPPDTETDKVTPSQPIQPPAPPPPPPPIPAPTAPTSTPEFANIAAVDTELERLRMTYIAGEITRETYYARRADLEAVRRSMATPAGPAGALGPKRLDLDMDNLPEPAQQQRPVLRRKPQDPGLSLELPLPGEDD
ncbi:hypothetical protein IV102_14135 [bacterium]|nr:hypothetical protein [bacterium]